MKSILIFLLISSILSNTISAQKITTDNVPGAVTSAFKTKFPSAAKVTWELEKKTEYEAEFKQNGLEMSANFDKKGKWLETETEIKVDALPPPILTALGKDFAGYKIKKSSKVDSEKDGKCFEAEISKGEITYDVLFASDGKIIHKSKIETEKQEKD